jgi:hypothetical protein
MTEKRNLLSWEVRISYGLGAALTNSDIGSLERELLSFSERDASGLAQ